MQSDDKPVNGQHTPNSPSFFDLLDQTPEPPVIDLEGDPGTPRFARLRTAWDTSWKEGGFLHGSGVPAGSPSGPWLMLLHLSS